MPKRLIYLFTFIIPYIGFTQTKSELSQLLWNNVQACYSNLEDLESKTSDVKIIDDSKNGYLYISGSYPTCGCNCSSSIGAYKDVNGNYTLLQSDYSGCDWMKKTTSNRLLSEILPEDFGIKSFTTKDIVTDSISPLFYVEFEIPQLGTDTNVNLNLVPFGMKIKEDELICYEYSEYKSEKTSYYNIMELIRSLTDKNSLVSILSGNFKIIDKADIELIEKSIEKKQFLSKNDIQEQLKTLKKVYDVYIQIECTNLTLSWNRKTAKFEIKQLGKKQTKETFNDFLLNNLFWTALC